MSSNDGEDCGSLESERIVRSSTGKVYDREQQCYINTEGRIELGVESPKPEQNRVIKARPAVVILPPSYRRTNNPDVSKERRRSQTTTAVYDGESSTGSLLQGNSARSFTESLVSVEPGCFRVETVDDQDEMHVVVPTQRTQWTVIPKQSRRRVLRAAAWCTVLFLISIAIMGVTFLLNTLKQKSSSAKGMAALTDDPNQSIASHLMSPLSTSPTNEISPASFLHGHGEINALTGNPGGSAVLTNFIHDACDGNKADLTIAEQRIPCIKACDVAKCCYEPGPENCSDEIWCEPFHGCQNLLTTHVFYADSTSEIESKALVDVTLVKEQVQHLCENLDSAIDECFNICWPSECCFNSAIPCAQNLIGCDPYSFCEVLIGKTSFALLGEDQHN